MGWLVVEVTAAIVAIVFGVKFFMGRRMMMEKKGQSFEIRDVDGKRVMVPEVIKKDLVISMEKFMQLTDDEPVVESVIRNEANRLKEICKRRRIEEYQKVIDAISGLFTSRRALELAYHELINVKRETVARDLEQDIGIEELEQRKRRLGLVDKLKITEMETAIEKRKLELERLRNEVKGTGKKPYQFDEFGGEDD